MLNLDQLNERDLLETWETFVNLSSFCNNKLAAIRLRKLGSNDDAGKFDLQCERYYEVLPNWARWRETTNK